MNTIWLKIAGVVVVLVIVVVVVGRFRGEKPSPAQQGQPKNVYDMFERDQKEFAVAPQQDEEPVTTAPAAQEPVVQTPPRESVVQAPAPPPPQPAQPHFEKLPIEQEVEAQRFHQMALAERKRSRLPMMTPKLMVDYCREIIRRWPKSEYAFQAKRLLVDIPERYKEMYRVTPQETDLSSFYQ